MTTDDGLYVAKGVKGFGVYAARTIRRGDEILTFSGPLIDFQGTIQLGEREGDALQIRPDLYVHLTQPGSLVNHSCAPNAGIVNDFHLIALGPIRPHEEICYDYSTSMADGHWTMVCLCGEPTCRGRVLDFHTLPETLRQAYLQRGVVQTYLVRASQAIPEFPTSTLTLSSSYSTSIEAK
ncbi:SET domain-containing protein-lysine N-methyltransferase [Nitrospira sp.]|nr:SET domain-containing protein-lysine N-methyltransferase [Nitrospira sp.]